MFGKEYANHLDSLTQSFGEIRKEYKEIVDKNKKNIFFIEKLKKIYILIFGIPEIGFQVRNMYFNAFLTSYLINASPKIILDAGSGIGIYTFQLARIFSKARVIGGEINKNKLRSSNIVKKDLHYKNVSFIYFDITKKQKESAYDLIINIDVLEHIKNYEVVLENFFHLLHNNGFLYIHMPQPNQKRIFNTLNTWHHEDHVHEGIAKNVLEGKLRKLGFKIIKSKETFGFFGKLAWEINHLMLARSFLLTGITFPLCYILAAIDQFYKNKNGLGVAVLAQKIN